MFSRFTSSSLFFMTVAATCSIGDIDATYTGAASINSTVSTSTFTWALASNQKRVQGASSNTLVENDFIFGAPSSLQLNDTSNFQGCALFFQGISAQLKLADMGSSSNSLGCTNALPTDCINDLQNQAKNIMAGSSQLHSALVCDSLALSLQGAPPASCGPIFNSNGGSHNWGTIVSKALTGPSFPNPIQLISNATTPICSSVSQPGYNQYLIANLTSTTNSESNITRSVLATTPIMTIFYPPNGLPNVTTIQANAVLDKTSWTFPDGQKVKASSMKLSETEVSLSCVKLSAEGMGNMASMAVYKAQPKWAALALALGVAISL